MWPSTDHWHRPETLGRGRCRGIVHSASPLQPALHACALAQRGEGPHGPGLLLQQNCKGWQPLGEQGGAAKQQPWLCWVLSSWPGQPLFGLRVRDIGCTVREPHGVEDRKWGEDTSLTLSFTSSTYWVHQLWASLLTTPSSLGFNALFTGYWECCVENRGAWQAPKMGESTDSPVCLRIE